MSPVPTDGHPRSQKVSFLALDSLFCLSRIDLDFKSICRFNKGLQRGKYNTWHALEDVHGGRWRAVDGFPPWERRRCFPYSYYWILSRVDRVIGLSGLLRAYVLFFVDVTSSRSDNKSIRRKGHRSPSDRTGVSRIRLPRTNKVSEILT
ncbi:hypothetical protein ABW19_dt0201339 [Dactylella cylindrospora]|nr:hypothetical protein ABW19_dt0201339 [Dactylella cylindrospora]